MNLRVVPSIEDPLHCPHCGVAIPPEDSEDPGHFRVRHLMDHIRNEALRLKDYGQGDFWYPDHCATYFATTWPEAAVEVRVCIDGMIGSHYEAMCNFVVEQTLQGNLGPRPADWSTERAQLSWTKARMHRWLDERYPPSR